MDTKIRVAGVTHKNDKRDGGKPRQDLLGTVYDDYWTEGREREIKVQLRCEPDNKHDPNAVAVYIAEPKVAAGKIGYVPATEAPFVGSALRGNRVRRVKIDQMGAGGRGARIWLSLALKIEDPDADERPDKEADTAEELVEDEDGRVYEFE